ncbi:MAG: Concanavalin A-like lectin/glucanases superfamily protein [Candidatus Kentron sp. G]|nr:MAG: Concanavalin A-like lectin/glucanases superfamily protein [Candidatus Kentron sp. G]VFM97036.1 MAG: Concanavalin A-like lectin/glucanases superfamily protein [Candidatus Kentron sp. G]VFM98475.1 MAG: Concanavalin A-like lectin/glucanases superfamily protein [Candidatus Kentron sp. G]
MKNAPKRSVAAWFLATIILTLTVAGIGLAPAQDSALDSVQGFSNGHFDTTGDTTGNTDDDLMDALGESGWVFPEEGQELVVLETGELCGHPIPHGDYNAPEGSTGEHIEMQTDNDPSLAGAWYVGAVVDDDNNTALRLGSDGIAMDQAGLTVHGPYACTNEATLAAGDVVAFDWRAEAAPTGDVYHVFAYLLNTATGETGILLDAGQDPAPLPCEADDAAESEAAADGWNRAEAAVSKDGSYRVVFLSGSFDATGNQLAGAALTIDNLTVTPATTGEEAAESSTSDAATDAEGNGESEPEASETDPAEGEGDADTETATDAGATASDTGDTDTSGGSVAVTGVSTAPAFTESDGTAGTTDTLSDGLVAYYPFNGNANDESGNGNDGTVNGATLTEDRFGNAGSAYSFNGIDNYIDCGNADILNINDTITLSAWINHTTGEPINWEDMFMKGNTTYGFQFNSGDDSFVFHLTTSGWKNLSSDIKPLAGVWYHVVGTYDGEQQKIYVDGVLKNIDTWSESINVTDDPLTIGYKVASDNSYFNGVIDEVRIYNRPLSETEVQTLYNEGTNTSPTLTLLEPDGADDATNAADASYTITWTDEDPDSSATIALYYDTDNTGADGTLIVEGLSEDDETDAHVWDTSGVPAGDYYVYGVISDGTNDPVTAYSPGALIIEHQHFTPVWSGNPYNRMNLWVTAASLDQADLAVGDEIGVFDGELCVGVGIVEETISQQDYLIIATSQDDGDGNGFTEGNEIILKVWDTSAGLETNIIEPVYSDPATGEAITGPAFTAGEDYIVELTALSNIDQTIELGAGWNIFSAYVMPRDDVDLLNLLQPVIDEGKLVKAIDEQGGTVIELLGSWENGIGDLTETEGYQVKVTADTALTVTGVPTELPFAIPLSAGWNIIAYPDDTPQDALAAVQSLIDAGTLVKIVDEQGDTILNLLDSWVNLIGDLAPGEGYQVKVTEDTALTIDALTVEEEAESTVSASRSSLDGTGSDAAEERTAQHFTPIWTGNPYNRMNLWVTRARLDGRGLAAGDEIGVFDGDNCVGVGVVEGAISGRNYLTIITSKDDGDGNGFTEGNGISFRIWDSRARTETAIVEPVYFDTAGNGIDAPVFAGNEDYVVHLDAAGASDRPPRPRR